MAAASQVGVTAATVSRRKVSPDARKGAGMRVGIKDGGDGVRCWNRDAVMAYADQVNSREAQIAQQNPDVVVLPGRLLCYGCEVMEYDYGIKCTAQLTRTRYAVQGETEPRAEDAVGSLLEVPGLKGRAPSGVEAEPVAARPAAAAPGGASSPGPASSSAPTPGRAPAHPGADGAKRSGLRGLFGR